VSVETFAVPSVEAERRPDGTTLLWSTEPLGEHDTHLAQSLRRWAQRTPEAVLATAPGGTAELQYGQARAAADALAEALLLLGAARDRLVMVLFGKLPGTSAVTLARYTAGVPVAPASEVDPGLVELEVAVPSSMPAVR